MGLNSALGFRVHQIDRKRIKDVCFAHVLIFLLYIISMCFVLAAAVVKSGLDLKTYGICRVAVFACLGFYVSSKVIM